MEKTILKRGIAWFLAFGLTVFTASVVGAGKGSDDGPYGKRFGKQHVKKSDGQQYPQRVIISTDNSAGIWEKEEFPAGAPFDDFLALMQALNEPSLEVEALLPMFGNHQAATAVWVTSFLLKHRQNKVFDLGLIARGADRPISDTVTALKFFRIEPDKGGQGRFVPMPPRACSNAAVRRMAMELRRGPITILALGPLTDVACLIKNYPKALPNIRQVVFLGGRYTQEPVLTFTNTLNGETYEQPLPDLNYNEDPAAAQIVLESGVPLVLIPGTLAQHLSVDFGRIAEHGTFLSRWLAGVGVERNQGARDDVPWDSAVINYLVNPQGYVCGRGAWVIVPCREEGEQDSCAGHDQDDRLGFLKNEDSQLWVDPAVSEEPSATICYAFETDVAERIQQRIERLAY